MAKVESREVQTEQIPMGIETQTKKSPVCPKCDSTHLRLHGFGRKKQRRYLCLDCLKTFMGPKDREASEKARRERHERMIRGGIGASWRFTNWSDIAQCFVVER